MEGSRSFVMVSMLVLLIGSACTEPAQQTAEPERTEIPAATDFSTDRCDEVKRLARISRRGLFGQRSPEIVPIAAEPNFIGGETTLVHSGPWGYLVDVPLVFYGPGVVPTAGDVQEGATVADIAPTVAKMIGFDRYEAPDGRVLQEAIGSKEPRVVVVVVWDGGGWNALRSHPDKWPFLAKMMAEGVSYPRATVGSNPSVTPSIHTSIGTGAYPWSHGVVGLRMRTSDGHYVNPLGKSDPSNIEVLSLGDRYDRAFDNRPKVGMFGSVSWHIGMVGKGAAATGGDKDHVVLLGHDSPRLKSNEKFYSLLKVGNAEALEGMVGDADAEDGKRDGKWYGRPLAGLKDQWRTPALVDYTELMLEKIIAKGGYGRDGVSDLMYVNFKSADLAGHAYSYQAKDVGRLFEAKDDALRRLTRFLDRRVGEEKWAVVVTADHGQTPYPKDSGAWPVRGGELADDINRRFDRNDDDVRLIDRVGASGIYINRPQLGFNSVSLSEIARWVGDYRVRENLKSGEEIPAYYEGEGADRIFDGVMVGKRLVVPSCEDAVSPG